MFPLIWLRGEDRSEYVIGDWPQNASTTAWNPGGSAPGKPRKRSAPRSASSADRLSLSARMRSGRLACGNCVRIRAGNRPSLVMISSASVQDRAVAPAIRPGTAVVERYVGAVQPAVTAVVPRGEGATAMDNDAVVHHDQLASVQHEHVRGIGERLSEAVHRIAGASIECDGRREIY